MTTEESGIVKQLGIASREKPLDTILLGNNDEPLYVYSTVQVDMHADLDNRFVVYMMRLPPTNDLYAISNDLSTVNIEVLKAAVKHLGLGAEAIRISVENIVIKDNYLVALGRSEELLIDIKTEELFEQFKKENEEAFKNELELFNNENATLAKGVRELYRIKDIDYLTKDRPLDIGQYRGGRGGQFADIELVNSETWQRMLNVFFEDDNNEIAEAQNEPKNSNIRRIPRRSGRFFSAL